MPASTRPSTRRSRPIPLVVSAVIGGVPFVRRSVDVAATRFSRLGRNRGSPPVNLTLVMPSRSIPMPMTRMISSSVSRSRLANQSMPSAGMQ